MEYHGDEDYPGDAQTPLQGTMNVEDIGWDDLTSEEKKVFSEQMAKEISETDLLGILADALMEKDKDYLSDIQRYFLLSLENDCQHDEIRQVVLGARIGCAMLDYGFNVIFRDVAQTIQDNYGDFFND